MHKLFPSDFEARPSRGRWMRTALSGALGGCLFLMGACTEPANGPQGEVDEGSASNGTSGAEAKVATLTMGTEFECLNELVQPLTPIHSGLTYYAFYEPLMEEAADYAKGWPSFTPRLAERYEASEDGLSLTYFLRPNAVWSDGEPITAEDVRFTWQAQVSPEVAWIYSEVKKRIRDVEVIDTHTVRFHFTEVYPLQVYDSAQGVILPKHAWGELPFAQWRDDCRWFNEKKVTSGPFLLDSQQAGQRVVLTRNDSYYEAGAPGLDRLVVEVVPDRANRLASLRSGRSHFIEFVDYADSEVLAKDPDIELGTFLPRNYYFIAWNNTRAPFDSPRVRKALTLAIDRQEIVDSFFYGYGEVSYSPLSSDVWAHHGDMEPLPYDPGAAKELLAAEGFTDSDNDGFLDRDGQRLAFELMTNSENDLRRQIMVMVQSQLERIGIQVVTRALDFSSVLEPVAKMSYEGLVAGLSVGTDLDLSYNFHTRGIGQLNWSGFSDPETDRLIDAINAEVDYDRRKILFNKVQERLQEMQPVTFLYEGRRLYAVRRPLTGVKPTVVSSFANLRYWQWQP